MSQERSISAQPPNPTGRLRTPDHKFAELKFNEIRSDSNNDLSANHFRLRGQLATMMVKVDTGAEGNIHPYVPRTLHEPTTNPWPIKTKPNCYIYIYNIYIVLLLLYAHYYHSPYKERRTSYLAHAREVLHDRHARPPRG